MADITISKRRRVSGLVTAGGGAAGGGVILKSSSSIPGPPGPPGPQGEPGLTGIPGSVGARGFDGGISFLFDGNTADEDPGIGRVRFDNATPASVTNAYMSIIEAFNNDISTWIQSWDDASTSVRGTLIFKENNTGQILIYNITGAITLEESSSSGTGDEGYCIIPLTYVAGTTMYDVMDLVMVQFVPASGGGGGTPFQTATFAATINIDCTTYKDWICTITGDCTINLTNASDGDAGMLELIIAADSSTGSVTITFGTGWTKKMGLTDVDGGDAADNIISWRKVGADNVVYTIAQIEV
jgi:hypothetical protein